MPDLLEARGLTKHYGSTVALDNASFTVQPGVTGLLGPNGAGKSTAIKLFLGLLRPTGGVAMVMGVEPYQSPEGRSRVGYMPEHDALPANITASEFLMHMAQVSGLPRRRRAPAPPTRCGTWAWRRSATVPWGNTRQA